MRDIKEILLSLTEHDKQTLSDAVIKAMDQELIKSGNRGLTERFQDIIEESLGVEE
jgi:hypothetical protein